MIVHCIFKTKHSRNYQDYNLKHHFTTLCRKHEMEKKALKVNLMVGM